MLALMEIGFEFPERLQERNIKFFVVKPRVQRSALDSDKLDQTCIVLFVLILILKRFIFICCFIYEKLLGF